MRIDEDARLEDYDPVIPMFVDPEADTEEYEDETEYDDVIPTLVDSEDDSPLGTVDGVLDSREEESDGDLVGEVPYDEEDNPVVKDPTDYGFQG